MVNPLDFVPKLSGFSPMPLGIMAPFMGYQSAALAYNFGLNYEFGKRVIKSMSNEKFNEIANDPILLNELTSRHHDVLLKAFINEVPKVDKIQDLIIKKMVELEFAKIKVMPELIAQIPKGFIEGIFALGAGDGSGTDTGTDSGTSKGKTGKSGVVGTPNLGKGITVITKKFLDENAQGRLRFNKPNKGSADLRLESKFGGKWNLIKKYSNTTQGTADGKSAGKAAWPQSGYNQYRVGKTNSNPGHVYWVLKSKL